MVWHLVKDYPWTLAEFQAVFPTEAASRDYLFRLRWPDGFRCPPCIGCLALLKRWLLRMHQGR
jgi:hypothetical protein